jgi:Zn-dependent protease
MKSTYSLGTVWGVRLGVNWSVLLLLGLIMWLLATEVFPETNPGLSDNAHFLMAVVASLAFFASIILHELGHAVQARSDGMQIEGVTLWLFGGVAAFSGGFPSANAELRIAAAGPAVSAVLSAAFLGLWLVPGMPESAAGVLGWLAIINVALLVFNLLPALPLDGGRILRALIWRARGDYRTATRVSARVAQVIAVLLIGFGLGVTVLAGGIGGLWLAFVAWFLLQAARSELLMAERAAALPGVADLMRPAPAPVDADDTLAVLVEREGWPPPADAYPVVEDGRPVGLLLLGDFVTREGAGWLEDLVSQHMLPRAAIATLTPHDDIVTALAALHASPEGRALVVDGGRRPLIRRVRGRLTHRPPRVPAPGRDRSHAGS